MIYWQNRILTNVKKHLGDKCKNVVSTDNGGSSKFPTVAVKVFNNAAVATDLEAEENAVACNVSIDAYSRKSLSEAIDVIDTADEAMRIMGFRRTYGPSQVDNMNSPEINRMVARYRRIIGADDDIRLFPDE